MNAGFYGLATESLESKYLRLEFLADAGPRVVRLMLAGSDENLLAQVPDLSVDTPFGKFFFRGGHRLWHSPESFPGSYIPDNEGLDVQRVTDGFLLHQPTEAPTGIQKSMEIHLDPGRPALTVHHVLQNNGTAPVELAAWAITQLPLGGIAILPQRAAPVDDEGLLPNRNLVLWPYTEWSDSRLVFHNDYLLFDAQARSTPCKVGYLNQAGWMGYLRGGILFVKRFQPQMGRPHPDFSCNAEVYGRDRFVELETIGALERLEPGDVTSHTESWELYPGLEQTRNVDQIRDMVRRLNFQDVLGTASQS